MTTTADSATTDPQTDLVAQIAEELARAFRRMRRGEMKELAPFGLTFATARVLRILGRAPEPMRIGDLAARLEIAPRSATSMVDALEQVSLAERRPDPSDRRSVLVVVTPQGRELLDRIGRTRLENARELFGALGEVQQGQLLALLSALNEPRPHHQGSVA